MWHGNVDVSFSQSKTPTDRFDWAIAFIASELLNGIGHHYVFFHGDQTLTGRHKQKQKSMGDTGL
jgi:hypothetical protein